VKTERRTVYVAGPDKIEFRDVRAALQHEVCHALYGIPFDKLEGSQKTCIMTVMNHAKSLAEVFRNSASVLDEGQMVSAMDHGH
jgi:hypothetical protein